VRRRFKREDRLDGGRGGEGEFNTYSWYLHYSIMFRKGKVKLHKYIPFLILNTGRGGNK
jgi:hypothetical protein